MSRLAMDDLRLAKSKLVKLTGSDNIETVVDEFLDIVKIFERHEITPDMIQPSKTGLALGPAVRNFIKKIKEGSEAHERGLQLLKAWKNIVTAAKVESSVAAGESKADEPKPPKLETASFSTSGSAPVDLGPPVNIQEAVNTAISKPVQVATASSSSSSGGKNDISNRRAARKVLLTAFKEIPSAVAEKVVNSIESALDKAFFDKEYSSKYRSLAANLKKNKALLQNVVSGAIAPHELIRLTPAELASQTIRETREKIVKEQASGRSMNWADENREKIYEQLGLDPNNAWIYDDEEDGLSEPDIETGDA